jgi:penicillin-binding protein 2
MTVPFANGGTLYKPHLVQGQEQVVERNLIHTENLEAIKDGMRQSCDTGGVAFPFFDFKVKNDTLPINGKDFLQVEATGSGKMTRVVVGCKTGTAQVGGEETKPHAWITVIAPIYNPEIVVTVLAENSGEGSSVAGPIAKQILTDYFENK